MKSKTLYQLIIILFISFSATGYAQMDRSIGRGQYKRGKKKVEKKDFVEESAKHLQKELSLDDFQAAAVRNILETERENITELNADRDMSTLERKDKASEISTRIYTKVLPLLSKEQAEKYTKLEEEKKF